MTPILQLVDTLRYAEWRKAGMKDHRHLADLTVELLRDTYGLDWTEVTSCVSTEIHVWFRRPPVSNGTILIKHPWSTHETDAWTWEMSESINDVRGAVLNRGQTTSLNTYLPEILADWIFRLYKMTELELMRHELVPFEMELKQRLDEPSTGSGP